MAGIIDADTHISEGEAMWALIETPMQPRVKRIRTIRARGFVAPMFVHPKPGRRIFAHVRFE